MGPGERVRRHAQAMEHLDRLLTVQDLANHLGVPVATIYAWRYRHEGPPGFRVGRHVRFRRSDVQQWISQQRQPSQPGR
ncbi:MAG: helix-turn-helix domain-containing protein [Acidimicrobiia bacterium]